MKEVILTRTSFSESPLHLLTMLEADILKNVVLQTVATALAKSVLPVPANKLAEYSHDTVSHKIILFNIKVKTIYFLCYFEDDWLRGAQLWLSSGLGYVFVVDGCL